MNYGDNKSRQDDGGHVGKGMDARCFEGDEFLFRLRSPRLIIVASSTAMGMPWVAMKGIL